MPKIEKLSRHLRRLTVREEYNDEMYSTVMQLEFNAFVHAMDSFANFKKYAFDACTELREHMRKLTELDDLDHLEQVETEIKLHMQDLTGQLNMVKILKRFIQTKLRRNQLQSLAAKNVAKRRIQTRAKRRSRASLPPVPTSLQPSSSSSSSPPAPAASSPSSLPLATDPAAKEATTKATPQPSSSSATASTVAITTTTTKTKTAASSLMNTSPASQPSSPTSLPSIPTSPTTGINFAQDDPNKSITMHVDYLEK